MKIKSRKGHNSNRNDSFLSSEKTQIQSSNHVISDSEFKVIDFFDLTQDEISSSEEINKDNSLMLGKKRKRTNENNNRNIMIKKNNKVINDSDNEESFMSYKSDNANINNANINYNNYNNMNNDNNNINISYKYEKEGLLKLVKMQGFNKIFNLLSNSQFDLKNPVEKKLDQIISQIGLLRTTIILLDIKFNHPISFSPLRIPTNPRAKSVSEIEKRIEERKKFEDEGYQVGEHLHKEKDGKIYKFKRHHCRVKGASVFYCVDKKCKARGLYNNYNMNFKIINRHSIPYEEHNYIKNKDIYDNYQTIFDDFKKKNCQEAQVFKNEEGDKLVKWYNN